MVQRGELPRQKITLNFLRHGPKNPNMRYVLIADAFLPREKSADIEPHDQPMECVT